MAEATWNQWRTDLDQNSQGRTQETRSGANGISADNNPATQTDDDEFDDAYEDDLDDGYDDEEGEPQDDAIAAQTHRAVQLSDEQLERIFNRQNEQFQTQQRETAEIMRALAQPQPDAPEEIRAPTFRELTRAVEENDMERYEQLLAQQAAATEYRYERRLHQLAGEAQQRFNRMDEYIAQTSVPEYKDYESAIDEIKKDLPPIPPEFLNHPGVRRVLVDAAKGRNINAEVEQRQTTQQQQRRRRSNPQTGAPTNSRQQTRSNARRRSEPVFTDEAYAALRAVGRTPEQHARALGYASWADYERATEDVYGRWDEINTPIWRRQNGGAA